MSEQPLYFTTDDVERCLDALEELEEFEELSKPVVPIETPKPVMRPPCERPLRIDQRLVVGGVFMLLAFVVLAVFVGVQ